MHLYINGFYWGLYNVVERPDETFGAAYFGSEPYAWDGQNSGTAINSEGDSYRARRSLDSWRTTTRLANDIRSGDTEEEKTAAYMAILGRRPDGTDDPDLPAYLDAVNYADYLITNYYGGNNDWPFKNYYFGRENSPDSEGFKFFLWDAEWSLLLRSQQGVGLINNYQGVAALMRGLRDSAEFRLMFADRVHEHLFNGGALYVDPDHPAWDPEHPERNVPAARYVELTNAIYDALIGESARWGDQHRSTPYTRDAEWQREFDRLMTTWFPRRTAELLNLFKQVDLYPDTEVPRFGQRGGTIGSGDRVTLSAAGGTIYYTLDGSDPRRIGGGLSASAREYIGEFPVSGVTTVTVRALNGEDWSAIDRATFFVDLVAAGSDNLRVSELHYHPAAPSPAEIAAGFNDQDDFEFIELVNISSQTIDLSEIAFERLIVGAEENGIDFRFADGDVTWLLPGQRVVVVEEVEAFGHRYGSGILVAGQWSGGLSNSSETITLVSGTDVIQQFRYQDDWYPATDGAGMSLEIVDASLVDLERWNDPSSWQASRVIGGTPGSLEGPLRVGDVDGDGVFGTSDLVAVFQAGEYEDGVPGNSTYQEGDWDGDGDFTSLDLVYAFQQGGYVAAAIPAPRLDSQRIAAALNSRQERTPDDGSADTWVDAKESPAAESRKRSLLLLERDLIFSELSTEPLNAVLVAAEADGMDLDTDMSE